MYKVVWSSSAQESLDKIDRIIAKKIKTKVETKLTKIPYDQGKPLTGNLKGLWRLRLSKYRVIYQIKEQELLILVVKVDHRRQVYKK